MSKIKNCIIILLIISAGAGVASADAWSDMRDFLQKIDLSIHTLESHSVGNYRGYDIEFTTNYYWARWNEQQAVRPDNLPPTAGCSYDPGCKTLAEIHAAVDVVYQDHAIVPVTTTPAIVPVTTTPAIVPVTTTPAIVPVTTTPVIPTPTSTPITCGKFEVPSNRQCVKVVPTPGFDSLYAIAGIIGVAFFVLRKDKR